MQGVRQVGFGAVMLALVTGGCGMFGEDEDRLEGDRIPVRSVDRSESPAVAASEAPLPPPQPLSEWTQRNSNAAHNGGHIAGTGGLSRAWRVSAGDGAGGRITAAPIVTGGRVFTLDGRLVLSSFAASSGASGWRTDLSPSGEDGRDGFGGGLAAEGGTIYATTGFGEVLAVDAGSGSILWRERFGAPFRAGPAVLDGTVIAVSRDNQAFGVDAASGRLLWRFQGAAAPAGLLGGASPAAAGGLVVLPFASGELVGVTRDAGRRIWTAALGGGRRGLARSAIADVTGDPVIVGTLVIAASQSGRIVAVDGRSGQRAWTRSIGSTGPLWAAGESVFVMGDNGTLARLSARTGASVWEVKLPVWEDPQDRENPIGYSGPVLVGGRVLVADDEGNLRAFDAETGREAGAADIGDGTIISPVAAGGLVYVLTSDGTLLALR